MKIRRYQVKTTALPYSKTEITELLQSLGYVNYKDLDESAQDKEYFSDFNRLHSTEDFRWLLIGK